jgi:hypothetical protein
MYNCISYNDGSAGITTSNNADPGREDIKWQIFNSLFYSEAYDPGNVNSWKAVSTAYLRYTESHNNWDDVGGYPGWAWTDSVTFTPATDWTIYNNDSIFNQLSAPRKADGSLPDLTIFRLAVGSDLIGAGIDVGMSATPDIGLDWAYLDAGSPPDPPVILHKVSRVNGKLSISRNNRTIYIP